MPFVINRKPPYRVFVEEGLGGAMAHVAELPGCFAVGSSAARAAAGTPAAIAQFLQWFVFNIALIIALLFVIVPITSVPGVPFLNFIFTFFQVMLVIWFWTLVKPSGGTPT